MAYVLNAVVAEVADIPVSDDLRIVPLTQGKGLIPLPSTFWKRGNHSSQPILREWEARHASEGDFEGEDERAARIKKELSAFAHISEICAALSARGAVAYLEAEFFAGSGEQASAVWDRGVMTLGPVIAADAINQALSKIGVTRVEGDEFEALGLQRKRFTEEW